MKNNAKNQTMIEHMELTKTSAAALTSHHIRALDEIKKIQGSLHQIIEQLAEREQATDL